MMTSIAKMNWIFFVLSATVLLSICLQMTDVKSDDYVHRDFIFDAAVFSYVPGEGINEYDRHGSGMAAAYSTVGFGLKINGVSVSTDITSRIDEDRFLVTVNFESENAEKVRGFEKKDLDLSDLKPLAIQLATSEQGRVYQLNLSPSVRVTDNTPRPLDVNKLRLQNWQFPNSPILVNDALYVGRIACAQSPVAYVDISGVAKVEFSLYHLTDATPSGVLEKGVVTLVNPDDRTKIQISNVYNGGPNRVELPGGPYRVWVRWSAPTHTVEEHRKELVKLRKRLEDGDYRTGSTDYLDKQLARDPSPWLISCGVHGLGKGDLAKD